MKKTARDIFIASVVAGLVATTLTTVSVKAGMWEKLSSLGDSTVETSTFSIEAKGWNLRAYEFITPSGARCVAMTGTEKGGLSCDFSKDWNK